MPDLRDMGPPPSALRLSAMTDKAHSRQESQDNLSPLTTEDLSEAREQNPEHKESVSSQNTAPLLTTKSDN